MLLWKRGGCEGGGGDCGDGWSVSSPPLEFSSAVTALDFAPHLTTDGRYIIYVEQGHYVMMMSLLFFRHILAVGLESGQIHVHYCSLDPLEWNVAMSLPPRYM